MDRVGASEPRAIVLLSRTADSRSVASRAPARRRRLPARKWQPPEGVTPEDAAAVIAAAACQLDCGHLECQRNELLLRTLWATGARVTEVLSLTPRHVLADSLIVPTLKRGVDQVGDRPWHRVFLPAGQADLPGRLLVWAAVNDLGRDEPLFLAFKNGRRPLRKPLKAIGRQRAWLVVKEASRRACVAVLAMRASVDGGKGEPAPIHPHIFRHARAREIVRRTKSLPLAQRQLGWSTLQLAYLSVGDLEARELVGAMVD
jgi:integrase